MKKALCAILCGILIFWSVIGGACTCKHDYEEIDYKEATCEQKGAKTLKCKKCSETVTQEIDAVGHDYIVQSNTVTCTEAGTIIKKCLNCNKELIEEKSALGHEYKSYGYCIRCNEFKYDIQLSVTLPREFKYYNRNTNHVYSKCVVTKVYFEIQDSTLLVFFYGSKTYDENGAYGDGRIDFTYVLKDSNGTILFSDSLFKLGLIMGESFGENGYIGKRTVSVNRLSTSETYTLEIVDKGI